MLSNLKSISRTFLSCTEILTQSKRTTFVLQRKNTPRLNKMGAVNKRKLKRRDYYYELVEFRDTTKKPLVDLILLKSVVDVGYAGEIIQMTPIKAYEHFIMSGVATYATPENIAKYVKQKGGNEVPSNLRKLFTDLAHMIIPVFMNGTQPWTLEPWHIRCNMQKYGIFCKEDAIILPEKKITGPDLSMDRKEFIVHVKINQYVRPIRCRLFILRDIDGVLCSSFNESFFLEPSIPLFPEDEELLSSMPKLDVKKKKGLIEICDEIDYKI